MPIYEWACKTHGVFDGFESVQNASRPAICPKCGRASPRIMSRIGKHVVDFQSGWDPGAGQYFDRKKDRENWVSMSGSRRVR